MRSTFAITATIATFVASALAATDCNPSYNVPSSTACYEACNVKNGQKYVTGWTMDPASPLFLDSLALMCDKTGANYGSFMAYAGMCMAGCTGDDPNSFNTEYAAACAWWNVHKNDKCQAATTTTTKEATTTTTKEATTTTTKEATTTTTKAATTTTTTTKAATTTTTTKEAATTGAASTSTGVPSTTTAAVTTTTAAVTTTTAAVTTTTATGASSTTTATGNATTTATTATSAATVTVTKTVTKTVSNCPAPTSTACISGYRGKKNGRGPENACCSKSNDCIESCVKGKCNAPKKSPTPACLAGVKDLRKGNGNTGFCCSNSDDCKETCRNGVCGL